MATGAWHQGRPQGYLFVGGTRPEAVKLAPLILAMKARQAATTLITTGQHPLLFDETLAAFGLAADARLEMPMPCDPGPAAMLGRLVPVLAEHIAAARPAAVVVQGDTTSALAGALAAHYAGVPLVHVEAGLRTRQRDPFPEEMHRRLIGQLADLHFAPTRAAAAALAAEGVPAAQVVITGNSGIDSLLWMADRLRCEPGLEATMQARFTALDRNRPLLLVTMHRRENHGAALDAVLAALLALAPQVDIALPVHPHPAVAGPIQAALADRPGIHLLPPLDYPAFVWLMTRATLALTDSGGVQEEAPALGLPVLVTRAATERPEGLASGNARMVGTDTAAIVAAIRRLVAGDDLAAMAKPALPYGKGDAGQRMAEAMMARFDP
ncbi:non-hydrolyzing UDP-N-acetylglucosamine 2-epimerase [Polymorphobacter sp.]|uniref:non-hydrolyzing UDP-N-acetylglucosamine 2-epimerase n=1 Tax=Polymorphobacter sp. TaxID=1909290 RepID=UPI003F6E5EB2